MHPCTPSLARTEGTSVADDKEGGPEKAAPFWRSNAGFAQLTAALSIVGAAITGTNAIATNWMQIESDARLKTREADSQDMKFQRELERSYFERAVEAESTPEARARVLRYVRDSNNVGADMKSWAQAELELVAELAKAQEQALKDAAKKEQEQALATQAKLSELPASATPEVRRTLEEQQARQQARATAAVARVKEAESVAKPQASTGKPCASVQALQLGPDDPEQKVVDGYCMSSAAGKRFATSSPEVTWAIRQDGKVFRCLCKL